MENKNPTPEQIAEMRQFSGENNISSGGTKPEFIGFNGKPDVETSGHFSIGRGDDLKDLGQTIKGVIVKVRSQYKTGMEDDNDFVTNDYDGRNDVIELMNVKNGYKVVATGTPSELKQAYEDKFHETLRFSHILYIFSQKDEKVYRLEVTGGSVNSLWEYLRSFAKDEEGNNDTVFRYVTEFSSENAVNAKGLKFMMMKFKRGDVYGDWNKIWGEVQSLNALLGSTTSAKAELLNAKNDNNDNSEEDVVVVDVTEDELLAEEEARANKDIPKDVVEDFKRAEGKEEIKVEDIPF